jgi:hypothetical protein
MGRAYSLLLFAAAVAGCDAKTPEPAKAPPEPAPAATSGELSGPVLEHLNAPPYLYLRVKTSQGEVWAAVPETRIETGAVVRVYNPMRMVDFESKALQRKFAEVYFGTLTPEDTAAATGPGDNPHAGVQTAAPVEVGPVAKAAGPDARTVAEVWAQKTSLEGKTVTIRGVVAKYNAGVMGKNWIHLQDGSGAAAQGTNDITVTSLDQAAKGATVTIRGTVRLNRDFGAGYTYAIIVEDAKVLQE